MANQFAAFPDRMFQLWGYTVGMGRLLLRSTKSEDSESRIGLYFQNVQAVSLLTQMDGIVVELADAEESKRISKESGLTPNEDRTFFSVVSATSRGYVVAGVMAVEQDNGDYDEPSEFWRALRDDV